MAAQQPYLIGSEIYRISSYGGRHPLAIPRVSAALDLIRAMGWLDESRYVDSPIATPEQLARFHAPDYIAADPSAETCCSACRKKTATATISAATAIRSFPKSSAARPRPAAAR